MSGVGSASSATTGAECSGWSIRETRTSPCSMGRCRASGSGSPATTVIEVTPSNARSDQVEVIEPSSATGPSAVSTAARTLSPRNRIRVDLPSPDPMSTNPDSALRPALSRPSSTWSKPAPPSTSSQRPVTRDFSVPGRSRVRSAPKMPNQSPDW